ncbi:MAG: ornithine carbamoyltransferase [Fibromonadaceae bacterium]|jgi:ornithine carbamoyltransferase|nr:ornithine carbamoyltransferase [Fibromonadaceae bacterium]
MDRSKHLLRLRDWNTERILSVIENAARLKDEVKLGKYSEQLKGKTIGMFFEKQSLRTITTFQVGMHQLGGMPVMLAPEGIGVNKRECLKDIARCLSRWVNGLVVRCYEQSLVEQFAEHCSIPIINALTNNYHPCQALAFGQTCFELFGGNLKGKTIAFIGDGNNVANSIMALCAKTGMNFTLACPKGFEQETEEVNSILPEFEKFGTKYKVFNTPEEGVKNADIVYTDVWISMGQEALKSTKQNHFLQFQVNDALLKQAPAHHKVIHCLPANRGEEITDSVMDNLQINLSYEEAENRLHAQKAVLLELLQN